LILFDLLGIVVGVYALYAVCVGRVFIKSGPGGRWVTASAASHRSTFWVSVVIYLGLAIALVAVF
jgi:hypothetical protein